MKIIIWGKVNANFHFYLDKVGTRTGEEGNKTR